MVVSMMLLWSKIDEPYVHGEAVTAPETPRRAEVVRVYSGEWDVFCYYGERMLPTGPKRLSLQAAKQRAADFVLGKY